MKHYKQLEHTADIGIRVWGGDLRELFIHSACAMRELIAGQDCIKSDITVKINIKACDKDELLRNWLSELLYYFNTKNILLASFSIESISDTQIISSVSGERIDKARHKLKHEIKAVTFHNLNIMQSELGLQTDIIFDV